MIFALLLAATGPAQSCDTLIGDAYFRCLLDQSLTLTPDADCEERLTQIDMNVCSYRDQLQHEIELNQRWNQVKARWGEADIYQTILDAQRSWLGYRDKQCAIWAKMYEGGTIASLMINDCRDALTVSRISELDQLLEEH